MANQEHLALLKQGVQAWNAWRQANPSIKPDLSDADLKQARLEGANFQNVEFSDVNLSGANLSKANLTNGMRNEIMTASEWHKCKRIKRVNSCNIGENVSP
jgi:hypothetical protein